MFGKIPISTVASNTSVGFVKVGGPDSEVALVVAA
jgi:hypothetical protein